VVPGGLLREEEARAHVDGERDVEVFLGQLEERLRRAEAGVVDEDVDRLERLEELRRCCRVAEVAVDVGDTALCVGRLQRLERARVLLVVSGGRVPDRVAVLEEALCDRQADAGVRR